MNITYQNLPGFAYAYVTIIFVLYNFGFIVRYEAYKQMCRDYSA